MITDNENNDKYTIHSQSSIIQMYCTMESMYLFLQGRCQLLGELLYLEVPTTLLTFKSSIFRRTPVP